MYPEPLKITPVTISKNYGQNALQHRRFQDSWGVI